MGGLPGLAGRRRGGGVRVGEGSCPRAVEEGTRKSRKTRTDHRGWFKWTGCRRSVWWVPLLLLRGLWSTSRAPLPLSTGTLVRVTGFRVSLVLQVRGPSCRGEGWTGCLTGPSRIQGSEGPSRPSRWPGRRTECPETTRGRGSWKRTR